MGKKRTSNDRILAFVFGGMLSATGIIVLLDLLANGGAGLKFALSILMIIAGVLIIKFSLGDWGNKRIK